MAKQQRPAPKAQPAPSAKPASKARQAAPDTLFSRLDNWFTANETMLFRVILGLCVLLTFFLFNVRISEGNDDSLYIEAGYKYAKDFFGYYYTANAPLYPMLLSFPIMLFGINLIALKLVSSVSFFVFILFLYKAFKGRVPSLVLMPVLFITAVNSYFLYYASQTYTECLYLMVQGIFLYFLVRLLDNIKEDSLSPGSNLKTWLAVGFFAFIISITRNVAVAGFPALLLFFLLEKKYRTAALFLGFFALFRGAFELFIRAAWGNIDQFSTQSKILMQVDAYDPSKGMETFGGFIDRFTGNINLYLGKRIPQIFGLKDEQDIDFNILTVSLIIILVMIGLYRAWRAGRKELVVYGLFTAAVTGASFFLLQIKWDQPRIIMIHLPALMMLGFYGIYSFAKSSGGKGFFPAFYFLLLFLLAGSSLVSTTRKSVTNLPILAKNLGGDKYYGYTPDWENYLKMSEYCGKELPESSYVAVRKAPMSFVYSGGKKFYPVYTVFSDNADTVLATMQRNKVTHVVFASLRRNPFKVDGFIINSVHRLFNPVVQKYPDKLQLVKQIGETEPAYLYKINY